MPDNNHDDHYDHGDHDEPKIHDDHDDLVMKRYLVIEMLLSDKKVP